MLAGGDDALPVAGRFCRRQRRADLESVIAGHGAGAQTLSEQRCVGY